MKDNTLTAVAISKHHTKVAECQKMQFMKSACIHINLHVFYHEKSSEKVVCLEPYRNENILGAKHWS